MTEAEVASALHAVVPCGGVPSVLRCWEEGGFCRAYMQGVAALGYEAPSVVQRRVIPAVMAGKDVIAQAPSGTGKTCAFALPCLHGVDVSLGVCQVLVLVPTWELVDQAVRMFTSLCVALPEGTIRVLGCSGAGDVREEAARCRGVAGRPGSGVHVVVSTPGRALALLQRRAMDVSSVKTLVLDEADEMIERFGEEVREVFKHMTATGSFTGQVVLLSATVSDTMLATCERFVRPGDDRVVVLSEGGHVMPECVQQYTVDMGRGSSEDKVDALAEVLVGMQRSSHGAGQIIVFCNANERVGRVVRGLADRGVHEGVFSVCGSMEVAARQRAMEALRSGVCRVLVTSDVTARGVDVQGVVGVVNFDVPADVSTYVHRVGRAGRFGRRGMAVTLLQSYHDQRCVMREVEAMLQQPVQPWLFD